MVGCRFGPPPPRRLRDRDWRSNKGPKVHPLHLNRLVQKLERASSLCSDVTAMPEVVVAFLRTELVDQTADGGPQAVDRPFCSGPNQSLQFREGVFNRIEIGAVRRQVEIFDVAALESHSDGSGLV